MFNKIVVPLDGSPLAEAALPYAEEIAGKTGAEMTLLTVLPSDEPELRRTHLAYSTKITELTKLHVGKYHPPPGVENCQVIATIETGSPAEGILAYLAQRQMSLVIMATHGRSGVGRWAIGSIADKIVRSRASQPLLLIRARGSQPDISARRIMKKALVPLDGSKESEAVVPYVLSLASSLQMEVILFQAILRSVNAVGQTEEYLADWSRKFKENDIPVTFQVRIGPPADRIIELADETACDLVAMTTHGQSSMALWPLGSIAQKVLLGGSTPLLLVRSKAAGKE